MTFDQLSIGQMAKLNRVSEQTLRLYDKMDLLKPSKTNDKTGYRYYAIGQSAVLDTIRYYKNIGMPLTSIKEELDKLGTNSVRHMLEQRPGEVEAQIDSLLMTQKSIMRSLDNFERYLNLPSVGQIFLEHMEERKILSFRSEHDILKNDYNHYEYNLRLFLDHLMTIGFPMSPVCNTGTIIRKRALANESLVCDEFYVLTNDFPWPDAALETVPAGVYLSVCCDGFSMERDYARILLSEVKKHDFGITGDYLCEIIYDYPDREREARQFFYKLQIPIK